MAIKAGTVSDFTNSMAEAMETALKEEYQAVKGEIMPLLGEDDRRMLLCAIAQGVVRHLKDNLDAFEISSDVTQVTGGSDEPLITSYNPTPIAVSGGETIAPGGAKVTQENDAGNRVRSRGESTIINMVTTGVLHS